MVEIMLKGLKMNHVEVRDALAKFNAGDNALDPDKLKAIAGILPLPDELTMLDQYDGDKEELARAEKYFLAISKIPNLNVRVNALVFKAFFTQRAQDVSQSFTVLEKALAFIKNDKTLHNLLLLVLALGNYLNGGTNRGGAYGYKLASLRKLSDCRSPDDRDLTLMHFLATLVTLHYASLANVTQASAMLVDGARENLNELMGELNQLNTGFAPIQQLLQSATCDPAFKDVFGNWQTVSLKKCQDLQSRAKALQEVYEGAIALFGEPKTVKPDEFIGNFSSFLVEFEQAIAFNAKKAEDEAKALKSKAQALSKPAAKMASGEFDSVLSEMRKGKIFGAGRGNLSAQKSIRVSAGDS
jgi:dishevelled associated activator of morphogenesis